MAEQGRLGALLDSPSAQAAPSTDDAAVLNRGTRARSLKLKASSCAQREHGQEVGQALPGSRGLRGLERLTDLLTMLAL